MVPCDNRRLDPTLALHPNTRFPLREAYAGTAASRGRFPRAFRSENPRASLRPSPSAADRSSGPCRHGGPPALHPERRELQIPDPGLPGQQSRSPCRLRSLPASQFENRLPVREHELPSGHLQAAPACDRSAQTSPALVRATPPRSRIQSQVDLSAVRRHPAAAPYHRWDLIRHRRQTRTERQPIC